MQDRLDTDWHKSQDARTVLNHIREKTRTGGLLVPPEFPKFDVYSLKVFINGAASVGKTALLHTLTAASSITQQKPRVIETHGMQMAKAHWPVKIKESGDVAIFSLVFWDAGTHAYQEFEHIQDECEEGAGLQIVVFSLGNEASWKHAEKLINDLPDDARFFVVGTGTDLPEENKKVAQEEVSKYCDDIGVPCAFIGITEENETVNRQKILCMACSMAL